MTDTSSRKRAPKGTPVGGQFAPENKPESDTDLDDLSFLDEENTSEFGGQASDRPFADHTPQQIDEEMAPLLNKYYEANSNCWEYHVKYAQTLRMSVYTSNEDLDEAASKIDDSSVQGRRTKDRLASLRKSLTKYETERAELDEKLIPYDDEFKARGGWPRAYLALSNRGGGHVHSSRNCSTCHKMGRPTTLALVTEYSGADEGKIVADAGYRACTVCFPSAPVGDENSLPTKFLTDEERQKMEKEAGKPKQEWCPGSGTFDYDKNGKYVRAYSPFSTCNHCGENVSLTKTFKMRKHAAK